MKHITERIRHKCNIISCTWDEYEILRIAFKAEGVKLRTTCFDADKVFFEIINPYKNYTDLYCIDNADKYAEGEFKKND